MFVQHELFKNGQNVQQRSRSVNSTSASNQALVSLDAVSEHITSYWPPCRKETVLEALKTLNPTVNWEFTSFQVLTIYYACVCTFKLLIQACVLVFYGSRFDNACHCPLRVAIEC
jgi:hypothetical protein